MTPPKDHTCEWRDAASALQERVAKLEATIAKLESARMRPHRSEKRPKVKLPPPVPPAPPAAAPRPNDDIRHAVLETAVEKLAVPEAKRTWETGPRPTVKVLRAHHAKRPRGRSECP